MFKRKAEIMQYQTDKLSYSLCIFGIIFDMIYFVSLYTNRAVVPDFTIGVDILVNIVFMMIAFLASEKLKAYEKKWNIYAALLGIIQAARVLWLPMHFKNLEMLVDKKLSFVIFCLLASALVMLLAGLNATINGRLLSKLDDEAKVGG